MFPANAHHAVPDLDLNATRKLRDDFAMHALQGLLATNDEEMQSLSDETTARFAYAIADAMMIERQRGYVDPRSAPVRVASIDPDFDNSPEKIAERNAERLKRGNF